MLALSSASAASLEGVLRALRGDLTSLSSRMFWIEWGPFIGRSFPRRAGNSLSLASRTRQPPPDLPLPLDSGPGEPLAHRRPAGAPPAVSLGGPCSVFPVRRRRSAERRLGAG